MTLNNWVSNFENKICNTITLLQPEPNNELLMEKSGYVCNFNHKSSRFNVIKLNSIFIRKCGYLFQNDEKKLKYSFFLALFLFFFPENGKDLSLLEK